MENLKHGAENHLLDNLRILEAIKERHSVRKYIDRPLDEQLVKTLREKVAQVNKAGNLHIQLVVNEPRAFKGKMAYGTFSGVSNYFAMVGPSGGNLSERIGYYGEQLVLFAQMLGLNTCWVGLTYNNIKEAYTVAPSEKLCCMIALGYGDDPGRNMKRKTPQQVSNASDNTPQWFNDGVAAALLAPTAINQQKFHFEYIAPAADGVPRVKATRKFSLMGYTQMDLGIAKYHFEVAAAPTNFKWL